MPLLRIFSKKIDFFPEKKVFLHFKRQWIWKRYY
jgi:hypothetical protein